MSLLAPARRKTRTTFDNIDAMLAATDDWLEALVLNSYGEDGISSHWLKLPIAQAEAAGWEENGDSIRTSTNGLWIWRRVNILG